MGIKSGESFKKLLKLLYEINNVNIDGEHFYLQLFPENIMYREYDFLGDSAWFNNDLSPHFKDKFIEFAGESDGSLFCLWLYPELKGEPPVVYIGSDGENCTIAPSMEEFICLLVNSSDSYTFETKPKNIWEELNPDYLDSIKDENPETYNGLMRRIELANNAISCNTHKTIINNFKKHPKFHKWVKKVNKKDESL